MPFCFYDSKQDKEESTVKKISTYGADDLEETSKITDMLNSDERVLLVARQSRLKPRGSHFTPNIVYATDRRIIIRDPYMLGIKENVVDIPYDIITSIKLGKGLLSSTIRFKASGLLSSTRLGMMESIVDGGEDNDQGGIIEAIPKYKAEDLVEIIRSRMQSSSKSAPSKKQKPSSDYLNPKSILYHSISQFQLQMNYANL